MYNSAAHKETELHTLLNQGNEQAFASVFKLYFAALCYFANKYVFDKQESEDIVEEVFEKLLVSKPQVNSGAHLRAYLYMATKRTCLDHLRKNTHAKERQMNFAAEIGDQEPEHLHEMIRAEVLREVYIEIKKLPEQCSKIITLSYIEGLKNEQIAEKLGLSIQTVKNQKVKGLSLLKGKLSPELLMAFLVLFATK